MAIINTTGTFANNDQVTSQKLNDLIDQAYFESNAVDGSTMLLSAGQLKVGTISGSNIASDSIKTTNVFDGSITPAKLSTGRLNWNDWTVDSSKVSTNVLALSLIHISEPTRPY